MMLLLTTFLFLLLLNFYTTHASSRYETYPKLQHVDGIGPIKAEYMNRRLEQVREFGTDLLFNEQLARFSPARVKRALEERDVGFVEDLRKNVHDMINPHVSVHCGADLMYFVDGLRRFVLAAEANERCKVGADLSRPSREACNCTVDATLTIQKESWVTTALDSFGKRPSGVIHGNFWMLGDFDECMNVKAAVKNKKEPLRMKYCNIDIGVGSSPSSCLPNYAWDKALCSKMLALHYGSCMPATCTNADVNELITTFFAHIELMPPADKPAENQTRTCVCVDATCHEHDLDMKNDPKAIFMTFLVAFIAGTMIASSSYDYFVYKPIEKNLPARPPPGIAADSIRTKQDLFNEQPVFLKFLLAFSVTTNLPKILDTTRRPGQIHCLNGLRFLSLCWVLLGHTYYWIVPTIDNLLGTYKLTAYIMNQVIVNATFCVDAFFFISAFLITYLFLQDAQKTKGSRIRNPQFWIMFYVHRYIRLTPVYMLIMGIDVCLYRYWADGPFWNQDGLEPNYCRNSWWTNLLYVNNFVHLDEQCMSWTWFLANDMQFFIVVPIFLVTLYLKEAVGVALAIVTLLGTGILKGVLTVTNGLPPISVAANTPDVFSLEEKNWDMIYIKPYCRCGPYIIGILFGYILFKCGKQRVKLPWWGVAIGWTLTTIIHLSLLFGVYDYSKTGILPNNVAIFFYAMFGRTVWAIGLAWIVFACINGYGGWVNKFLSWGAWAPFAKITYCAYLLHPYVAHGLYSSRHRSFHFDTHLRMVYNFIGHVVLAYSAALVFSLAFESPIMRIENQLTGGGRAAKQKAAAAAKAQSKAGGSGSGPQNQQQQDMTASDLVDQSAQTDADWLEQHGLLSSSGNAGSDKFVDALAELAGADSDIQEHVRVVETNDDVIEESLLRQLSARAAEEEAAARLQRDDGADNEEEYNNVTMSSLASHAVTASPTRHLRAGLSNGGALVVETNVDDVTGGDISGPNSGRRPVGSEV